MARDLFLSEEAESDLDHIWDYITKDSPYFGATPPQMHQHFRA